MNSFLIYPFLKILVVGMYKIFEHFEAALSQFIAELAAGDDDAPVGVVAYAFALSQKRI